VTDPTLHHVSVKLGRYGGKIMERWLLDLGGVSTAVQARAAASATSHAAAESNELPTHAPAAMACLWWPLANTMSRVTALCFEIWGGGGGGGGGGRGGVRVAPGVKKNDMG
jgi:hypothetical protein